MLTVRGKHTAAPTVQLFPPSAEEMSSQGKATLVCLMADFHPRAVEVEWLADGTTITDNVVTSQPEWQSNNKYMASSYLTMDATDYSSRNSVTCKVKHEVETVQKTVNTSQC